MSWITLVLLLLGTSGRAPNELVSIIDADAYFKHHKVEVTAERMAELAAKDPSDAPTQVAQLLAIDWLGRHAAEGKKARPTLEQIMQRTKAQDKFGFARDHAARALARLDGKPLPAGPEIPADSLRADAYRAFPDDVTMLGGVDLRSSGEMKPDGTDLVKVLLMAFPEPETALTVLFDFADQVGNLRLDRAAFAVVVAADSDEPKELYFRLNGAGELGKVADFAKKETKSLAMTTRKGSGGEKITLLASEEYGPAYAFIGNTEIIVAGYQSNKGKHVEVIEKALATRAGDKPNALKGAQAALLKQIPDKAFCAVAGALNEPMRKQLAKGLKDLKVMPRSFLAYGTRDNEIHLHVLAKQQDEAEAMLLVEGLEGYRKQAVDGLKNPPPDLKLPKGGADTLIGLLNDCKFESSDKTASCSLNLSAKTVEKLMEMLKGLAAEHSPRGKTIPR